MEKAEGQVKDVIAKPVKIRGEDRLMYEVTLEPGGKYATQKKELADEAMRIKGAGQLASVTYTTVQKEGKDGRTFTNHYLDTIIAVNAPTAQGDVAGPEIPVAQKNGNGVSPDQLYRGRLSNMNGVLQYAAAAGLDQEALFELFHQVQNVVDGVAETDEVPSTVPKW